MKHDPEKNAATYLSGTMTRRRRDRFEEHILECEDCWSEVELGRRGRSLAEGARVLTPQRVRERVRMSVEAIPPPPRPWKRVAVGASLVAAAAAAAILVIEGPLGTTEQPVEIARLVADFESGSALDGTSAKALPEVLGDLRLQGSRRGRVDDMRVTAHSYIDPAGHEVVVYQADDSFPVAHGADHGATGETWTATIDGAVLFCADRPVPSLVIGDDRKEVELAAAELGLR